MRTVAVTGANGKTGRGVVEYLLAQGYQVRPVDVTGTPGDRGHFGTLGLSLLHADLTDFGDTVDALTGVDGVVHLAAIPAPGFVTDARTLHANTAMSGNVFLAAAKLGLGRVVWASSETSLGLPFGPQSPPRYLPVDEDHYPYPASTYALSKVIGETQARHVSEWSGIPIVALRLSNVHDAGDYPKIPSYWTTRFPGSGTSGVTSTSATWRRPAGSRCTPTSPAHPRTSSPPPTRSWTGRRPISPRRSSRTCRSAPRWRVTRHC
jgi:nucleoside-diphosphate-sugar epimerase